MFMFLFFKLKPKRRYPSSTRATHQLVYLYPTPSPPPKKNFPTNPPQWNAREYSRPLLLAWGAQRARVGVAKHRRGGGRGECYLSLSIGRNLALRSCCCLQDTGDNNMVGATINISVCHLSRKLREEQENGQGRLSLSQNFTFLAIFWNHSSELDVPNRGYGAKWS